MRTLIARILPLAGGLVLFGCASRPLPKYEQPLARAAVMNVRTTAYTHTEADHVQYSNRNALGTSLQSGAVRSAAADWSRWPAGSMFRIRETGEVYQVDDYGWALSGTNTIDLYKPSRGAMNSWGVRRVTIENLRWGDPKQSLGILRPRSQYRHIKRMVDQLEDRMSEWMKEGYSPQVASGGPAPAPVAAPAVPAVAVAPPVAQPVVRRAVAAAAPPVVRPYSAEPVAKATPVKAAATAPSEPNGRTAQTSRSNGTSATREAFLNSIH